MNDDQILLKDLTGPYFSKDFKFYTGSPLITPEGFVLGTLVVIGKKPFEFDKRN